MICEITEDRQEVMLRKATFSDVIAVIQIWLNKDKEICYTNPNPITDDDVKVVKWE